MSAMNDADDLDHLAEIVDMLCDILSSDQTLHKDTRLQIASIAERARSLYRKRVDNE